jgi:hypothetical protein
MCGHSAPNAVMGVGRRIPHGRTIIMAKGQKKSNKEARKPKKEVAKKSAANPSTKGIVADLKR